MEEIVLKNSDIKVSRICMGGCPMGGYGWGDTQENELIGVGAYGSRMWSEFF